VSKPTFIVVAGPNGAGKTTLYEREIKAMHPDAEFINADRLAQERFGHPAQTKDESAVGQQLAEVRRRELMAQHKSLVTESTFSHESKIDLVRDAKDAGYDVLVYHVNVRNADLAVMRVQGRVAQGGHPVPEDKTRGRYERNQPLIREAALLADHAYIYDNSALGKPHRLALELHHGQAVRPNDVPPWARQLYAPELERFAPADINSPAASYAAGAALAQAQLGSDAKMFTSRAGGKYAGPIIGATSLHTVQQIAEKTAVAHFTSRLSEAVEVGDKLTILYDRSGSKASVEREQTQTSGELKLKAAAFRSMDPVLASRRYPDLAGAYACMTAAELKSASSNPKQTALIMSALKERIATSIERGERLPQASVKERATKPDKDRGR
jgi:predicted ABC-type ATPase